MTNHMQAFYRLQVAMQQSNMPIRGNWEDVLADQQIVLDALRHLDALAALEAEKPKQGPPFGEPLTGN